jgi:hypothetical protein
MRSSGVVELPAFTDPDIQSVGPEYGACLMHFNRNDIPPTTNGKVRMQLRLHLETVRFSDGSEYKYDVVAQNLADYDVYHSSRKSRDGEQGQQRDGGD